MCKDHTNCIIELQNQNLIMAGSENWDYQEAWEHCGIILKSPGNGNETCRMMQVYWSYSCLNWSDKTLDNTTVAPGTLLASKFPEQSQQHRNQAIAQPHIRSQYSYYLFLSFKRQEISALLNQAPARNKHLLWLGVHSVHHVIKECLACFLDMRRSGLLLLLLRHWFSSLTTPISPPVHPTDWNKLGHLLFPFSATLKSHAHRRPNWTLKFL
jgi:hypothetical protein